MLRGLITFPGNASPEFMHAVAERLKGIESSREQEILVLSMGATYTRYPIQKPPPAIVRRARALHR